ncbi:YegS/Rv2252/BmrU family lipid kinase [Halopolyspora algeriensis]|uniref:YegS/Rv2252/BmrU family lipid kinase n=1 Tax=Halopolyspora algeriensis TaxID=1500506 RepID=A0A368W1B4_9ACTN|nr:lipid kinase [Halopolyspora algeriensis]RCW47004.1 YegS/Rv2252/BmrU family lipid kinase [Halopolyspora algeriensis]TQM48092.1 YegS/Rv2252/BmrU family lipid kinase [Halopolyspora algeriensis]
MKEVPIARDGSITRVALVVNTRSRTGSRAYNRALELLRGFGLPITSAHPLQDPTRLPETVQEAVDEGNDLVVVGGGDGTISSIVDMLAHREVPLGLLPLGTANDFARTLHVPTDLEQACRTIAHGKIVDIDLGLSGNNYYANRASIGLGASVAKAMSPALKKRIGALAYPVATIRAWFDHKPFFARLTFPDGDHEPQEYPSLMQISVANGRYYGGGQIAAQDSGIDDSTLDISVIRHGGYRELVTVARGFRNGNLLNTDQADFFRTRRVRVETTPKMPVNIDGELVAHTPQDLSVARNALHVIVPRTWVDGR